MRSYKTTFLQRLIYPSFIWSIAHTDAIYLTFDDGPTPEVTPWVLDQLDCYNAKATFFCIGQNLKQNKHLAVNALERGHKLANHTFHHLNGWKTDKHTYKNDVFKCDDILKELEVRETLFRPPYGRITKSQLKAIASKKTIMWSFITRDFIPHLKTERAMKALKKAKAGDIILFHDSVKAFDNLKQLLPGLLAYYQSQNLKFRTIA